LFKKFDIKKKEIFNLITQITKTKYDDVSINPDNLNKLTYQTVGLIYI